MAHVTQMPTQEPILQAFLSFCFKPNLLSAHKLTLLIFVDNIRSAEGATTPPPRHPLVQQEGESAFAMAAESTKNQRGAWSHEEKHQI